MSIFDGLQFLMILHFLVLQCTTNGATHRFYILNRNLHMLRSILNPILTPLLGFWISALSTNCGTNYGNNAWLSLIKFANGSIENRSEIAYIKFQPNRLVGKLFYFTFTLLRGVFLHTLHIFLVLIKSFALAMDSVLEPTRNFLELHLWDHRLNHK